MKMQIAVTGRGGQGVLFLTKILTECALELGEDVMGSEIHGMAMRGGSVISTVKIGSFRGSLIRRGQADLMLVLDEGSMEAFTYLLSEKGTLLLNAKTSRTYPCIDATGLAAGMGSPLMANLVLLGFAVRHKKLFCDYNLVKSVTERLSPPRFKEANIKALDLGTGIGGVPNA